MRISQPNLFTRHDTLFGVCEAIGQDFGFNPLYLRVAFGVTILLNPAAVLGTYLALGLLVAISRWIYPSRSARTAAVADRAAVAPPTMIEAAVSKAGNDDPLGVKTIAA